MSHHHQSHQYQPQNPSNAVQPSQPTSQPTSTATPIATNPKAGTPGANASDRQPSADHIRTRAYEISQARNGGPGNATSDWSQAEKELTTASTAKA
jgi:hypothetical protein